MLIKRKLIVSGLFMIALPGWAAEIAANLDRSSIQQAETVQLAITLNGGGSSADPDLKPLMNDFDILGTMKSNQVTIINGHKNQQLQWQITLAPRHAGTLTVPPLSVGSLHTQPLTLSVTKTASQPGKADKLFMEIEVQPKNPYVRSQVLYTIRLLVGQALQSGTLTEPVVSNAILLRLGEDSHYQTTRGGRRYEVVERRYGIFPQKSGKLTIAPPTLLGQVLVRDTQDLMIPQSRPIRLTGEAVELQVLDKPAAIAGNHWLPAQDLTLRENWSSPLEHWRVGDPITRTLTLSAVGLGGEQLPDLSKLTAEGFNVYAEQPKVTTSATDRAVLGQRVVKLTYIPIAAGTLTIPAVEVAWWNTQTHKNQHINLAAKTLPIISSTEKPTKLSTDLSNANAATAGVKTPAQTRQNYWPWAVAIAAMVAWLLTLGLWWRQKKRSSESSASNAQANPLAAIKTACLQNNPQAAKIAILDWAKQQWPQQNPLNLGEITEVSPELIAALKDLETILYAPHSQAWDGATFWSIFEKAIRVKKSKANSRKQALPPLYPE